MKSRNLFIGILVLFTGVVALLSALGIFEFHWSILWKLWPMILIITGIALLPLNDYVKSAILLAALGIGCLLYHSESRHYEGNVVTRFFNRHFSTWNWDWNNDDNGDESDDRGNDEEEFVSDQSFSEPFAAVDKAALDIDFGAGDITLKAPCAELVKVDANSNFVKYSFRAERQEDHTAVFLKGEGKTKKITHKDNKNEVDFALCSNPTWDLSLDMGAANADLDFSPYKMENIKINGGACNLDLKLGDHECNTTVELNTGASKIDIMVPADVDCQIHLESAITGKDIDGFVKVEKGLWQTPNYGEGTHQILLELSCAVSDISVKRY